MTARTITGEINAYLSSFWFEYDQNPFARPEEWLIERALLAKSVKDAADWICIGTAKLSIELVGADEITANQVQAIREQIERVHVDAASKVAVLEDQLKKLLALTYDKPSGIVKREQQP